MAMLGAGNSGSTAVQSALDQLIAAGSGASSGSTFHIPIRTGDASATQGHRMVGGKGEDLGGANAGQYSGETNQTPQVDKYPTTNEGVKAAIGAWYSFDDQHRSDLMKQMWYLGLTRSPSDFDGAFAIWNKAVTHAANFAMQGREIDPQHVIEMMADAGSEPGKNRQQKTTATSIDLTNPEQAKAWVQQAFQQSMGRNADDAEVRALVDALHQSQQEHPTVTTNTPTKWDAQGNAIESNSTKTGGVDPNSFFAAQMAADPEASAHQAASTLYPALLQALHAGG
jgi:hypothetical protein